MNTSDYREYNLKLKNNWDDITIEDYFALRNVTGMMDILAVLTSVPQENLKEYPLRVINDLIEETDFIHGDVPINDSLTNDLLKVRVEGDEEVMYRLNLNVGEWESGRFIDFMEFSSDAELLNDNMHLLMVLCCDKYKKVERNKWNPFSKDRWEKVPRKDRDLLEEAEWGLRAFPISTTLSFLTFFLTSFESFSNDIVDSLDFTKVVMESLVKMDTVIHHWSLENPRSTETSNGSSG